MTRSTATETAKKLISYAENYMLVYADGDDVSITSRKLQVLLFAAQQTWLDDHDEPLFDETIVMVDGVPTIPSIDQHMATYNGNPIDPWHETFHVRWGDDPEVDEHVRNIWRKFGPYEWWSSKHLYRTWNTNPTKSATTDEQKTYDVVVTREDDWWALTIEELGLVGLVKHLDNGRETARSRMTTFLDVNEDDIDVICTHRSLVMSRSENTTENPVRRRGNTTRGRPGLT